MSRPSDRQFSTDSSRSKITGRGVSCALCLAVDATRLQPRARKLDEEARQSTKRTEARQPTGRVGYSRPLPSVHKPAVAHQPAAACNTSVSCLATGRRTQRTAVQEAGLAAVGVGEGDARGAGSEVVARWLRLEVHQRSLRNKCSPSDTRVSQSCANLCVADVGVAQAARNRHSQVSASRGASCSRLTRWFHKGTTACRCGCERWRRPAAQLAAGSPSAMSNAATLGLKF